ncbi:class I SAM-dependent methyltransferase [Lentibacillus sp. N15]|uniref:class I SAM-dependent methyltransferase n=1 Tax=Lentibacillus songyuanensis TaxID=3136161 RepID=UPI0031BA304E
MAEHYFSQQPQSKSSPKTWSYQLKEKVYTFTSDHGVFSKNEVDYGTRLLIEQFTEPKVQGRLLDLGCGYGPIGVSVADHFPNRHVTMADINQRALNLAQENAAMNHVDNVDFVASDRFTNLADQTFAAILTNPPIRAGKHVIHKMYEESKLALVDQGELWVVIQKKQGAPSTKEKLHVLFGNVEAIARSKGYFILRAIK